jgi:hypothetical protein
MQGVQVINSAKQSLAGLLATNDATVMALNQQVTGLLATTGMMPPDLITTQMGGMVPGMMGATGMPGMMGGTMMPGAALLASTTVPFANHMGMMGSGMPGMMGGSMMRGSLTPPGATIFPQQMMGSNAITPMAMTGSFVGPFGGGSGMGISVR